MTNRVKWKPWITCTLFAIGLILATSKPSAVEGASPTPIFAYGMIIGSSGGWDGVEPPSVEIPAIISSGATYVRVAGASGPALSAGIPDSTDAAYLSRLRQAGINLGVAIFGQDALTADQLIQKGLTLKRSGWYDWIFVDDALSRSDIQQIIDGLRNDGWDEIMINASPTGTSKQVSPMPGGVWAYAFHFYLLSKDNPNPDLSGPTILPQDIAFLNYIHSTFPTSLAVMKLEVPPETARLASYPLSTQESLLNSFASQQATYGYTMIYPLFTDGGGGYDSIAEGTYQYQVALIENASPATFESSSTVSTASYSSNMSSLSSSNGNTVTTLEFTPSVSSHTTRVVSSTSTFISNRILPALTSSYTTIMAVTVELTTSTTTTVTALASTSTSSGLTPPTIAGFPWESIMAGVIVGMIALAIARRRK